MNRKLADESYTGDEYLIGIKIYFSLVKIGVMRLFNSSTEFKFRWKKNISKYHWHDFCLHFNDNKKFQKLSCLKSENKVSSKNKVYI